MTSPCTIIASLSPGSRSIFSAMLASQVFETGTDPRVRAILLAREDGDISNDPRFAWLAQDLHTEVRDGVQVLVYTVEGVEHSFPVAPSIALHDSLKDAAQVMGDSVDAWAEEIASNGIYTAEVESGGVMILHQQADGTWALQRPVLVASNDQDPTQYLHSSGPIQMNTIDVRSLYEHMFFEGALTTEAESIANGLSATETMALQDLFSSNTASFDERINTVLAAAYDHINYGAEMLIENYIQECNSITESIDSGNNGMFREVALRARRLAYAAAIVYLKVKAITFPDSTEDLTYNSLLMYAGVEGVLTTQETMILGFLEDAEDTPLWNELRSIILSKLGFQ